MLKNIKLTIQYDGSGYSGWQYQDNALSIQEVLEKAIEEITGQRVNLHSSGRTDAGVHALGQVANFKVETDIRPDKFYHYFLKPLPEDIKVVGSEEVPLDFHSRFDAVSKTYLYRIYNGDDLYPMYRNTITQVEHPLDINLMREGASRLLGEKDFSPFAGLLPERVNPIRTLDSIKIRQEGKQIELEYKGQSFLRYQIRIMTGTLVQIGRGIYPPDEIDRIFSGQRTSPGPSMAGRGLYLIKVDY